MDQKIQQYFELFELSKNEKIDKIKLKKKYYRLCLKYHPDKNKNMDNKKFIELQQAYNSLLDYANVDENNKNDDMTSIENNIYQFFVSFFNKDNLEKIFDYVDKIIEHQNEYTINYFIELEQLFNKSLFYNKQYNIYIPLWHKCITLSEICSFLNKEMKKEILFVIKLKNMSDNIKIINNNNIVIYVDNSYLKIKDFTYKIAPNKTIRFSITPQIVKNKYHVCLNEGIPIVHRDNIYDFSSLSHIIVCFI